MPYVLGILLLLNILNILLLKRDLGTASTIAMVLITGFYKVLKVLIVLKTGFIMY